jgi:hypothetical protein
MAEINAQRARVDHDRDMGYQGVDRNVAARGLGRSSIRTYNRTRVAEQADEAHRALSRAAVRAANARQQRLDTLTGDYQTGLSQTDINSNVRQKQLWEEQNPITVDTPAPRQQPSMSYKEFLRGRKSTKALAHQWDKKFNYGQRFG